MIPLLPSLFVLARSSAPTPGHEISVNAAAGCWVRVVRIADGRCFNSSYTCDE
jgi:hypothetical protein